MISLSLQVRRAVAEDHRQIAGLVFHESNTHRHLDWRSALDWIGSQNYWVLDDAGLISAAFACPEDPPDVAWIRLFTHQAHLTGPEAWSALWESACAEAFQANPRVQIAAISVKQWFQNILLSSGFELMQDIVLLQRPGGNPLPVSAPAKIRIRSMRHEDLLEVTRLDLAAFGPFWHNSLDSLQRAYSQAIHATVAENDAGMIGYQISTGNTFGAHLARLAVRPEAQGMGVGSALVGELIRQLNVYSTRNLSVNTQADNIASLALYKRLGFVRTGEYFPVFVRGGGD
ncbi:MAG: GNAT family N-acetyltransferase [Chloroflexi bacterium]|nr:GNAT family N-acetyltransferase [Chloroflexota bacterium]